MSHKPHIIATFYDRHKAEQAFHALQQIVPKDDVSFMHMPDTEQNETQDASADGVADGVGWGAAAGGVGGLALGLSMLLIPGIGPILALGPIYTAISGATVGGIIGGLADMGINRYTAEKIEEHLDQGAIIITVEVPTSEQRSTITQILYDCAAIEIVDEPVQ